MWSIEESALVDATPEVVWELWQDVEHWNVWDHGVSWSRLNGAFVVGSTGELKPKSGPKSAFKLVEVEKNVRFKDISQLPLCRIEFDHRLAKDQGLTRITHTISIVGPLSFIFARLLGKQFKHDLREAVQTLAQLARERHAAPHATPELALT